MPSSTSFTPGPIGRLGRWTATHFRLVALVSPWFLLLTAFVGVNQWLYVVAGACPASLLLGRCLGLRPASDS